MGSRSEFDVQGYLEVVAGEVLEKFGRIAAVAAEKLGSPIVSGRDVLVSGPGTITGFDDINRGLRASYAQLLSEPAVARVKVILDDGSEKTYYICRGTPVTGVPGLGSYRSPVGRLAALGIGAEWSGGVVEESARLNPRKADGKWDSANSVLQWRGHGPISVVSLRAILSERLGEAEAEDLIARLLQEESHRTNVIEGVRRNIIEKMGLRDQPILDRFQDEIFRLPLDARLLLLGPPGTGKTTTLIRRLGQKLDREFLEEAEQDLVLQIAEAQRLEHSHSWVMFTPTELLKQFLKEAFAREGVPVTNQRLRTWQDYRRELGRETFGILRSASGGGAFILKETLQLIRSDVVADPMPWLADFEAWQRQELARELREAAQSLERAESSQVQALARRLAEAINKASESDFASAVLSLASYTDEVLSVVRGFADSVDANLRASLTQLLRANPKLLEELAVVLDSFRQVPSPESDEDDEDESEAEDDEATATGQTPLAVAMANYFRALRAHARSRAKRRNLGKASKNARIIAWLGGRVPAEEDLRRIGESLVLASHAKKFAKIVDRLLGSMARRYRAFRRLRSSEGKWYEGRQLPARDIGPLEVDLVIAATLRAGNDLLSRLNVRRDLEKPYWSALQSVYRLRRTQVLVDEVTDFSPIQVACMAALADPELNSFFACGDFNQRLTSWGSRSSSVFEWLFPDLSVREVTVTYRQSRQLTDFARSVIHATDGVQSKVSLPTDIRTEGVSPALLEGADLGATARWIADRVSEVVRFVKKLPSTAVFVNSEEEVAQVAAALNEALGAQNIPATPCHDGQAVGSDGSVRVFDVRHIKGLEFEAVFFLGLDRLAAAQPDLFGKYLYVGSTRAATYLGAACDSQLPAVLEGLRGQFVSDWTSSALTA